MSKLLTAALTLVLSGCGGNVNLGERQRASEPSGAAGAPNETPDAEGTPLVRLENQLSLNGTLAVSGSFFYFPAFGDGTPGSGLYRCEKSDCEATLQRVGSDSWVVSLQVYDGQLGVAASDQNLELWWIGSYALPRPEKPRITLGNLPAIGDIDPLFYEGFAYFKMRTFDGDALLYRCALPSCADGPETVAGLNDSDELGADLNRPSADSGWLFFRDEGALYRTSIPQLAPAERLDPGETLAVATRPELSATRVVSQIAGDGTLYATLTAADCIDDCPHRIVRWPAPGGKRETLIDDAGAIGQLYLFGSELAWLDLSAPKLDSAFTAYLTSCRIDACEATRRRLGVVDSNSRGVTADDDNLFWIETRRLPPHDSQGRVSATDSIHTAPLLR